MYKSCICTDVKNEKKWFQWAMAAAQAAENLILVGTWYLLVLDTWNLLRLDLTLSMRDIYINSNLNPLTKFNSSSRSTKFKVILPCNISQMITKTISISTRTVVSNAMKQGTTLWIKCKGNEDWDNNMIRISQWRESHCRTNTCVRRKKEMRKSRTVRATVRDPSKKVNHLKQKNLKPFEIEKFEPFEKEKL